MQLGYEVEDKIYKDGWMPAMKGISRLEETWSSLRRRVASVTVTGACHLVVFCALHPDEWAMITCINGSQYVGITFSCDFRN